MMGRFVYESVKKKGNPFVRNIFLAILIISIIMMILIEHIIASIVLVLIFIGDFFRYNALKKQAQKMMTKISDDVADAMANKIIFESQQHRKNRDSHNYIKTGIDNQE